MSDNLGAPQDPVVVDNDEQPIEIEHEPEVPEPAEPPPSPPPKPPPIPPVAPQPKPAAAAQPAPDHLPGEEPVDDSQYGAEVQKRIQQLRYLGHSERRAKDAALRERDQAVGRINELGEEVTRLRSQLEGSEQLAIGQALDKAAARIEAAKSAYAKAHEAGDVNGLVAAQEALATAIAERDRVSVYRRTPAAPAPTSSAPAASPAPTNVAPPAQELDLGTTAWLQRNQWFFNPAYKEMRDYATSVHHRLEAQGIVPGTPREAEYFATIDQSLRETFPVQFGSGAGQSAPVQAQSAATAAQNGRTETRTQSRPVTPTAGTRTASGTKAPVKVTLNQRQVQLCQRLGIKEEDYARELIKATPR